MTRISLCMIVRDEAPNISACLASVAEAVDEIIVVDTGSVDHTVELAQAAGAKVVPFVWCDDFSAARNAALPHASGDWVLMIDADQRLAPGGAKAIRDAVAVGGFDCGVLPQYDALSADATPADLAANPELFRAPVHLHCLFVNDADLRWQNRVHEVVAWVTDSKRTSRHIAAPMIHYGNLPDVRMQLGKHERNFRLIEKSLAADPDNLILQVYFLAESYHKGPTDAVRAMAEAVWDRLVDHFSGPQPERHPRFLNAISIHMWFLAREGRHQAALEVLQSAGQWGLEHPAITWMGATSLENLAYAAQEPVRASYLQQAEGLYNHLLAQHGQTFPTEVSDGVTSWLAAIGLGRIAARQGRADRAQSFFKKALADLDESHDQYREARFGYIEALLDGGFYRDAMRVIRKSKSIQSPELVVLRADALEQTNHFGACVKTLTPLLCENPPEFQFWSIKQRYLELICLIQLYRQQPLGGTGPMGVLGALLAGQPPAELEDVSASERLSRVLRHLTASAETDFLAPLFAETTARALPTLYKLARAAQRPDGP